MFGLGEIQFDNLRAAVRAGIVRASQLVAMRNGHVGVRRGRHVEPIMRARRPQVLVALLRREAGERE